MTAENQIEETKMENTVEKTVKTPDVVEEISQAAAKERAEHPVAEKTPAKKTVKKTTDKTVEAKKEKAPAVKKETKPPKKKGKKDEWVKKEKPQGQAEQKSLVETLKEKWKPVFWGRFGKKNLRTRNNPKFDKWRKPRGIDMLQRRDDGMVVATGYRTPKAIRGIHPSGYTEVLVSSRKQLEQITPAQAARFSATIGRKKRISLQKIANEKKIRVLN